MKTVLITMRFNIARALIRKSPMLLMDEAASALEPWTEQRVLDGAAVYKMSGAD